MLTHCHFGSHVINTQLGTVSAHDTKVDSIEDHCDSDLDPRTHGHNETRKNKVHFKLQFPSLLLSHDTNSTS